LFLKRACFIALAKPEIPAGIGAITFCNPCPEKYKTPAMAAYNLSPQISTVITNSEPFF
jgi:hypothetical protein